MHWVVKKIACNMQQLLHEQGSIPLVITNFKCIRIDFDILFIEIIFNHPLRKITPNLTSEVHMYHTVV